MTTNLWVEQVSYFIQYIPFIISFTVKWTHQMFVNLSLSDLTNLKSQKRSTMKSIIKFAHVILVYKGL